MRKLLRRKAAEYLRVDFPRFHVDRKRKVCQLCGNTFFARRSTAKWCSGLCRHRANRRTHVLIQSDSEGELFDSRSKADIAIQRIRSMAEVVPPEALPIWVGDSGGKDSTVVLDLVKRSGVPFEAHFSPTTVDPPEVIRFIRRHHPETVRDKVTTSMWAVIRKYGILPTRYRRFCCRIFQELGRKGCLVVTGVRRDESVARSGRAMFSIVNWSAADVWDYIRERSLPYCSLYDEGFERVGCVCCPLKSPRLIARDIERWPGIAARWRAAAEFVFTCGDRSDVFRSADELWEWWISGQPSLNGRRVGTIL